ncbi:hypothetical protein [Streptomyces thermoalcalitolerans]
MVRRRGGPGSRPLPCGGPGPRRVRLLALLAAVAGVAALPLAAASAGQTGDRSPVADRSPVSAPSAVRSSPHGDGRNPSMAPTRSPLLLGLGPATAVRCGPKAASPGKVQAQTCVLTQGQDTWARTYYRNTTGRPLDAALTLMGPGERTVRTRCAPGEGDEPGMCETPRERLRGEPGAYTAVAEFAERGADGPLLLRSGSKSPADTDGW